MDRKDLLILEIMENDEEPFTLEARVAEMEMILRGLNAECYDESESEV